MLRKFAYEMISGLEIKDAWAVGANLIEDAGLEVEDVIAREAVVAQFGAIAWQVAAAMT